SARADLGLPKGPATLDASSSAPIIERGSTPGALGGVVRAESAPTPRRRVMQGPIGFIGLGIMGRPMAKNLLKAGYGLVVHNRSQAAVQELVGLGAKAAESPEAVARQAQV